MSVGAARALGGLLITILGVTVGAWLLLLRPVPQPPTHDPLQRFNHGSIGNEGAQGIPYWIWRVLPQVFPQHLPGNQDGYASIGLFWRPGEELPVGMTQKTLGVIPRVSINCAFCHQGSYRVSPTEPAVHVTGGAGSRVNPQGYIRFLGNVGSDPRFTSAAIMDAILAIYDMPAWERVLYRFLLIPATRSALIEQKRRMAWTESRPDWGPGRIDPFNPVKFRNLRLGDDGTIGNSDMMPLWGLNHERTDPSREYSLHWDGLNRSLREVVVSGAIGDGMDYKTWPLVREQVLGIEDSARLMTPPPSPFSSTRDPGDPFYVAEGDVLAGRALYERHCADCHSPRGSRFRTVIPAHEMGTDRHRLAMWSEPARERYADYDRDGGYRWDFRRFHNEDGYVAVELSGLWLKGPYLHNGSVPHLKDLLEPAESRPRTFFRGYDLVDADSGGFVSQGPLAERHGWEFDTALPGNSNAGHEIGVGLGKAEKARLLGYLKTL